MIHTLEMTVLIDNVAAEPLVSEWGLSILITADDRSILLDTGASHLFAQNAERLGVDLNSVDTGVLSHAHYDHADGMDTFFSLNRKAPFLVREGSCENCYGIKEGLLRYIGIQSGVLKKHEDRIRYVSGVHTISEGIWLVPHRRADYSSIALRNDLYTVSNDERVPDDFAHEQSLVIETGQGLVVFNSCSHTGMTNILTDIREMLGRSDVCAYIGGLHLYKMTDEEKKQLSNFETSLRHLIYLHDKLRRDHAELQQLLLNKEEALSKLRSEYDQLNQSYMDLKSAMAISLDGGDVRQTKQRLSKIVREVDKCIAMLNQS